MHAALSTLKPLDAVYHSALCFITGDGFRTYHCVLYDKVGRPSRMVSTCRVHTMEHGGGGVMVWGCFAGDTLGDLFKIQG